MNAVPTDAGSPAGLNKPRILSNGALFSTLDRSELETIALFASVHVASAGTVICAEGSAGDAMYVIASGRVQVSLFDGHGGKIIVGVLQQGGMFGEVSLLDGGKRTATVETLEPSELLAIQREDFLGYLQRQPLVAIKLLAALAARLRSTNELVADTLLTNLASKLAKALLQLAKAYGYDTFSGIKIDVKLYEEELAYRTGIAREKVVAQLDAWKEKGLLEVREYRLVILDRHALVTLV